MATRITTKKPTKKLAVKVKPKKAPSRNGKVARKVPTHKQTKAKDKEHELAKCLLPGDNRCPAVNGKESSFMYQQGCRGEACRIANRAYYRNWRAKKAAAATTKKRVAKKTVKKAMKKKAPAKKKRVVKKTAKKR